MAASTTRTQFQVLLSRLVLVDHWDLYLWNLGICVFIFNNQLRITEASASA